MIKDIMRRSLYIYPTTEQTLRWFLSATELQPDSIKIIGKRKKQYNRLEVLTRNSVTAVFYFKNHVCLFAKIKNFSDTEKVIFKYPGKLYRVLKHSLPLNIDSSE